MPWQMSDHTWWWRAFDYACVFLYLLQMFQCECLHSRSATLFWRLILLAPSVHDFSRYTSRQTTLNLDTATYFDGDISHHFPLLTLFRLLGSAGSCQTKSGMQWGFRRAGILPCLYDSVWLTMAARLPVFYLTSQCPGFQLLSLPREGMSVLPLWPWKHSQKKWQQCSCIQHSVNDNIVLQL